MIELATPNELITGREPLNIGNSYLRSKFFQTDTDINLLVAAAAPLLSLITRFQQVPATPDLSQLHHDLCHEVKTFANRAQTEDYPSKITLAARYTLCCAIDETILTTHWGKDQWQHYALLKTFQRETWGGERFFTILERASEDSQTHIDLLELIYLLLRFGYQGKYRQSSNGQQAITDLTDQVYKVIRYQRGLLSKQLLVTGKESHQKPTKQSKHISNFFITAACALLVTSLYFSATMKINFSAKPFQELLYYVKHSA